MARQIKSERLHFKGKPTMDPRPYLDEDNLEGFAHPERLQVDLGSKRPPHARVLGTREEQFAL